MKKNLANNFLRKIVPLLLVCGLLVGISGITLSPQKTSAAYYPYADLNGALLPGLKQDLQGYTVTLNGMGLSATDAAPVRRLIESAATQVQTAIDTMEDTPAWIASANDAVAATDAARTGLWSLQQGGSPSQQTNLSRMEALCNANDPSCTPAMRAQITSLRERIASRGVVAAGGTPQETCDSWALFKPVCWIRLISVVIGSLLISIAAMFLALADMLFNWTVLNTILLFSTEIFAKVKDGINAGWTAMRDIANIVIIGMFTFIAISTILGIQEYAAKKLLARVLIIAVLINFSLLFTKIIIDASNFTAAQFYASTVGANSVREARDMAEGRVLGTAPVAATVTSSSLEEYRGIGISGAFIRFLGVTSVSKTYESLDRVANNGGGWYVALAHGLLGALLLGGAAGVLFYGAYLLISRAVLFIFLMVTAAGAFATHLIPKMNESTYGWQGWWSSLLHNAALAPLLMIFLYITLRVAANITPTDSALGTLASPTAASTDIKFLFLYFIILGLLWGSFLLASKWASKVGGLGFTGTLLSSATVGTAALASRFVAAPIARKVFGGGATRRSMTLEDDLKEERLRAAEIRRVKGANHPEYQAALDRVAGLMKKKDRADLFAKGSFNLPNTKLAQQGMKALGIPSFLSGAQSKPTSYADSAKKRAEEAIKAAEKLVLKKEDVGKETRDDISARLWSDERITRNFRRLQRAAREMSNAARMAAEHRDQQVPALIQALAQAQTTKAAHEQTLTTVSGQRDAKANDVNTLNANKAAADAEAQSARTRMTEILSTSQAKVAGLDQLINSNATGSVEHTRATNEKAAEIASRTILVQAETNKINAAQAASATAASALPAEEAALRTLNANVQAASTDVANATSNVTQINDDIGKFKAAADDTKARSKAADEELAKEWNKVDEDIKQAVDEEVQQIVNSSKDLAVDAAARSVHRRVTNFGRYMPVIGNVEETDQWNTDIMTDYARKMAKSSTGIKYKEYTEMWKALGNQFGAPGTAPAAAPAAAAAQPPPPGP